MYGVTPKLEQNARPVLLARASEHVALEFSANVTDHELVPAPLAGWRLIVYDIALSTGTAGTVLFEQGAADRLMGALSLAANGNFVFNSVRGLRLPGATSLTMTTMTGAGPLAVTVGYATVPVAD